jgi:hypothetical protein
LLKFIVLSCLVSLECTLKGLFWRMPEQAYTATVQEHHTPMGRVLGSCALEPSQALCGSDTCMPILDKKNTIRSDPSHESHLSKICPDPNYTTPDWISKLSLRIRLPTGHDKPLPQTLIDFPVSYDDLLPPSPHRAVCPEPPSIKRRGLVGKVGSGVGGASTEEIK